MEISKIIDNLERVNSELAKYEHEHKVENPLADDFGYYISKLKEHINRPINK